jgi:putative hemolysin
MTASQILAATAAQAPSENSSEGGRYSVVVASTPAEIQDAQRLRYDIFAGELGATLHCPQPGLDIDEFDEHCDHLVVRHENDGATVGTYRMLRPDRAPGAGAGRVGRLYSDGEFDLGALAPLRNLLVETGRSCVHPEHRNGAVINLMWTAIARYLHLHSYRWLIGCASVPVGDGGTVQDVWRVAHARHLAPPRLRATPWHRYPVVDPDGAVPPPSVVPALLRGYLRLGAWVCGPPAHDRDFGVADFLVLLSLDRMNPRYLTHFLGTASQP